MKRFLLSMICAIAMVAANAQSLANRFNVANLNNVKMSKTQTMKSMSKNFMLSPATKSVADYKVVSAATKSSAAAPATAEGLEGNWIAEYTDWAGNDPYSAASQVEISLETIEGVEYVYIPGLAGGYADVYGLYDAEAGVIAIPAQTCYDHPEYGEFVFAKGYLDGENVNIDTENPYLLTVTVEENGHITLTGEEDCVWVTPMTGEWSDYIWNLGEDLVVNKANYEFTSRANKIGDNGWTGWAEEEPCFVYFENIEGTGIIHGMFDSSIMVSLSEEGYDFTIPNGQIVTAYSIGGEISPFYTYNAGVDEEGYLDVKLVEGEDICMPDPEFEIGAFLSTTNSWVIANTETNYYNYIYIARFITMEGSGYFDGVWGNMILTPIEGEPQVGPSEEDGIASVANEKNSNDITFNAAGQKVNKDYKGLVIRNGQKFMNK